MSEDAFEVQWRPPVGPARKIRFEPRSRSDDAEYTRVEFEWTGCAWRHVGEEPVQDVVLERDAEILDEDDEATDADVAGALEGDR